MKPILLLLCSGVLLTSCTQFQYLTVSGVNVPKNEKNELVSENDTVKIQYRFADYKGQIGVSIYNKTGQPLEIDWKKSAVIIDGKAISYFSSAATIAARVEKDSLSWRNRLSGYNDPVYLASLNGSIYINEPTQFIPPSSFIYKVPLSLPIEQLQNLPVQSMVRATSTGMDSYEVKYEKIAFDQNASPVKFRSYLTFRIGETGAQKEFTMEHNFFISEVWRTMSGPGNFPSKLIERGDRFYL